MGLDSLKDVGFNFLTGGLYSVGKAAKKTVETGDPSHLLTQGLDVGLAAVGNELALELGGQKAAMAFNIAGGLAGAAGAAGVFAGSAAAGGGSTVAPLAATPAVGTAASGSAEIGAVTGQVAPAAAASGGGVAAIAPPAASGLANNIPKNAGSDVIGNANAELSTKVAELGTKDTKSWFESLSPGAQTALITGGFTAAQMVTGAAGGLFAGVSAQKKLELERLINDQTQAQIQYKNKNNSYAPLLNFQQPGMVNTPIAPGRASGTQY